MKIVDYHVYRSFVNITSLQSTTNFLNATGVDGERAQVHSMHRALYICFDSDSKPVKHDIISKQFELAIRLIKEENNSVTSLPRRLAY